jgi:hypothetical protein
MRTVAMIALSIAALLSAPSAAAQDVASNDPPKSSDSSNEATSSAPLSNIKMSGYGEASYSYSSKPVAGTIVGRLYDRFANQFTLNAFKLAIERPYATDRWDAGVRADVVFGQNAAVLQSAGMSLGPNTDITQLFVTLNVPTKDGNGWQFKVGKLVTLMGLELIETVSNPNWSEGNQFVYVENFTHTGLEVGRRFSPLLDIQLRVCNGWDRVTAADGNRDVMVRVGLTPNANSSLGIIGYSGAMEAGSDAMRSGVSVLANKKAGANTFWVQADYGTEEANAALPNAAADASWWALGLWVTRDFTSKMGAALRVDYLADTDGFRTTSVFGLPATGVDHRLWSATATLNIKTWPGALVRPEMRFDSSNFAVFDGSETQVTGAFSVAYVF